MMSHHLALSFNSFYKQHSGLFGKGMDRYFEGDSAFLNLEQTKGF